LSSSAAPPLSRTMSTGAPVAATTPPMNYPGPHPYPGTMPTNPRPGGGNSAWGDTSAPPSPTKVPVNHPEQPPSNSRVPLEPPSGSASGTSDPSSPTMGLDTLAMAALREEARSVESKARP
jgi:hypothetical protein